MVDQIVGFFMFALGMKTPNELHGMVKGDATVAEEQSDNSGNGDSIGARVRTLIADRATDPSPGTQVREESGNTVTDRTGSAVKTREQIRKKLKRTVSRFRTGSPKPGRIWKPGVKRSGSRFRSSKMNGNSRY